jgi:hypothetical protein
VEGVFDVRVGQVPPVSVKGTHGSAFGLGIHGNCGRGAEAVRKSLADTDAQMLGPSGQRGFPTLTFPFETMHDVTNLRRRGKSRICMFEQETYGLQRLNRLIDRTNLCVM